VTEPQEPAAGPPEPEPDYDWSWADEDDDWVPPTVDTTRPTAARIYDYALGGKDNFEIDRLAAERIMEIAPDAGELARANRAFLHLAVRSMASAGIGQFLDLGTGIPLSPSVHETARAVRPGARVVYVDNDPVVIAHVRAMRDGTEGTTALQRDLRDPAQVLSSHRLRQNISLGEPVGVLLTGVLHFVDSLLGPQVMHHYIDRLAPGSHIAFSVLTPDGVEPTAVRRLEEVYRSTATPLTLRTLAQTEELIDGLTPTGPGVVDVTRWTAPATQAAPLTLRMYCGIARKD
jgi:hypothetical protein